MLRKLKVWGLFVLVVLAVWVLADTNARPDGSRMITSDGQYMRFEPDPPRRFSFSELPGEKGLAMTRMTRMTAGGTNT